MSLLTSGIAASCSAFGRRLCSQTAGAILGPFRLEATEISADPMSGAPVQARRCSVPPTPGR